MSKGSAGPTMVSCMSEQDDRRQRARETAIRVLDWVFDMTGYDYSHNQKHQEAISTMLLAFADTEAGRAPDILKPLNIMDDTNAREDAELERLREKADAVVTSDGQFIIRPAGSKASAPRKDAGTEPAGSDLVASFDPPPVAQCRECQARVTIPPPYAPAQSPSTARQLAEATAQKLWQWVDRGNVTGPLDPADLIEAAILDGRKELEAQLAALDLKWAAASRFVRDVIEATSQRQPEQEGIVDLPELALQVVGQIEHYKTEVTRLEEVQVAPNAKIDFLMKVISRAKQAKAKLARVTAERDWLQQRMDEIS